MPGRTLDVTKDTIHLSNPTRDEPLIGGGRGPSGWRGALRRRLALVSLSALLLAPLTVLADAVPEAVVQPDNGGEQGAVLAGEQAATDISAAIEEARTDGDEPEIGTVSEVDAAVDVVLWYFWRDGCPHCTRAEGWLETLQEENPELELRKVEVVRDAEGRARFIDMMSERGAQASGVPAFILGDAVWVGFTPPLAEDMEAEVEARLAERERDPTRARSTIDLGPFGTVDVGAQPMFAATVLIAFIDGFNPCSLWVLTVLLAMILGTRSRARIAAVGLTFLFVTASIYGVFIAGLFAAFVVAGHLGWIQVAVAFLALAFGAVNVKDFFAFKQGLSFTIPDRFKPKIYRGGREVRKDRPLLVTLAITVALAAGVALIELPCTAGFPVVWTTLVSDAGIGGAAFFGLLGVYLLVYLSVEVAILVAALVTLRASRLQDQHGRTLKLIGGMVMIALAIVILIDPTIMEQITGSLIVIATAIGASIVIMIGDKMYRSRKGKKPAAEEPPAEEREDKPEVA